MESKQQERIPGYDVDPSQSKLPSEAYYEKPQNQRYRDIAIVLIVLGLLWLGYELGGSRFFGATSSEVFSSNSQLVVLDLGRGDLHVEVEDRDDIVVEISQSGFWSGKPLLREQDSEQLKIHNDLGFCFFRCSLSYHVTMPANLPLEISTTNGDVMLYGELGPVQLSTRSGDISISNTRAALEIETRSGDIELEDTAGSVFVDAISSDIRLNSVQGDQIEMSTISGDIKLFDLTAQTAQLRSTSGDIEVRGSVDELDAQSISGDLKVENDRPQQLSLKSTSGDIEYRGELTGQSTIATRSGDVELELNRVRDISVSLSTSSGSIDNYLPLDAIKESRREIHGSIGNGSSSLSVTTTSGDIELKN